MTVILALVSLAIGLALGAIPASLVGYVIGRWHGLLRHQEDNDQSDRFSLAIANENKQLLSENRKLKAIQAAETGETLR